jgi:hypothetical protein
VEIEGPREEEEEEGGRGTEVRTGIITMMSGKI